jgi:glutathione peroxidase
MSEGAAGLSHTSNSQYSGQVIKIVLNERFCTTKYNVAFPMFAKISVKGGKIHPLYKLLASKQTNPEFGGGISWNFNKFMVDRSGKIVARFSSKDEPESEKVIQTIEQSLKQ